MAAFEADAPARRPGRCHCLARRDLAHRRRPTRHHRQPVCPVAGRRRLGSDEAALHRRRAGAEPRRGGGEPLPVPRSGARPARRSRGRRLRIRGRLPPARPRRRQPARRRAARTATRPVRLARPARRPARPLWRDCPGRGGPPRLGRAPRRRETTGAGPPRRPGRRRAPRRPRGVALLARAAGPALLLLDNAFTQADLRLIARSGQTSPTARHCSSTTPRATAAASTGASRASRTAPTIWRPPSPTAAPAACERHPGHVVPSRVRPREPF
jgi:hypothetical protein